MTAALAPPQAESFEVYFPPSLRPHQREFLSSAARFKLGFWGRQAGKTSAGAVGVVGGHGPGGIYRGILQGADIWWVSSVSQLGDLVWRTLKAMLWKVGKIRESQKRITLPTGGAISVKSADLMDHLRGPSIDGVVLDELGLQRELLWTDVLLPTLAKKSGWAMLIGTVPRSAKSHWTYKRLWSTKKDDPAWSLSSYPSALNIAPEELVVMKKEMGTRVFERECEGQWITTGGGMFPPEWRRYYDREGELFVFQDASGVRRLRLEEFRRFGTLDPACKLKERNDYTALGAWGAFGKGELALFDMFPHPVNGERIRLEGPDKRKMIRTAVDRWKLGQVWVESLGDLMSDCLAERLPVREITAEYGIAKDKVERAEPAQAAMEGGRVWLPRSASWLTDFEEELEGFPPEGAGHDDQVDNLSYAVRIASKLYPGQRALSLPRRHGDDRGQIEATRPNA